MDGYLGGGGPERAAGGVPRRAAGPAAWAAMVGLLLAAAPASAEGARVLVLGIRSPDGDDALARRITEAIASRASKVPGWALVDRRVSLSQMMLVHGCDEADATCMASIAESLDVDHLVYGTLRRTGAGADYDFALALERFDRGSGRIGEAVTTELARSTAGDTAAAKAPQWVARMAGQPLRGTLVVRVNVPGATVRVDGAAVGTAEARDGEVRTEVEAGRHRVEVGAEGYGTFSGTVHVPADEDARIAVELEERASGPLGSPSTSAPEERVVYRSRVTWPTYLAFGSALVFAGVSTYAFVRVSNLRDDGEVLRWGDPDGDFDLACDRAEAASRSQPEAQQAVDLCNQANRLEPVRWVFLALAAAAGGTGGYLLWRDLHASERRAAASGGPRLRLTGSVGPNGARAAAAWQF